MAGALVGGSFLSAFLQVLFDRMASREFVDFFKGQKLSDELLMKLKITMRSINRLLDDAEEKQITNRDVQMWLDDLKDAVYEADDLLDEIAYEGLRSEIEAGPQTNKIAMLRNFLSSRSPFNKRIVKKKVKLKKILDRLKDLVEQKDVLGLAKFVSGEFCYTLDDANGLKLAKKTRHLSYVRAKHGNLKKFEGTYETQFLRTFLLMEQSWKLDHNESEELDHNESEAMHDLLPTLKRSRIKELGELQHLRGTLEIWNLQNVVDAVDALTANLKGKKHLEHLQLRWHGDTDDAANERVVLEQLQHHTNVESISIIGYGGPTFPEWVGDSSFSNIVSLTLGECKRCSSLPPLGQLASLKYLVVQAFDGVVVIGTEFYGSRMKPFGNLEELRIERMPHLHEWISSEGGAFPVLQELYIKECPNLSNALPSHLPSLTTLEIERCQQLAAAFPTTPPICRLKLDDISRDVLVTKLPSGLHGLRVDGFNPISSLLEGMERMGVPSTNLEEIEIRNCGSLTSFPLQMFSMLKSFQISECPNLESLVAYERTHGNFTRSCLNSVCPDLTLLRLWNCSNVKSLPKCMHSLLPSLEILQLVNCPELESFPEEGLPVKLQSLQIRNCRKLIAGRMEWNLQALQCLSHFSFGEYEDIESFPEKTLLPTTLITLGIWDLQNLKSLDYEGLQHLTSLTQMRISHCPNLQSMPEEGLPSSLSSLIISQCPLLEQRCLHNRGEDWPKISHIPDIDINWDS
ncbi:hypothetical protein POTOM_006487 [Populus tomentosa]|uniref:Rx N-terminal domain-containing protein n=1 Tax=Populus tomentosa TaxID=118781 RepID=A0A8X8ATG4_POPTO|nr:hypothetical protein POTOM_006487 [Populus tomentosa]